MDKIDDQHCIAVNITVEFDEQQECLYCEIELDCNCKLESDCHPVSKAFDQVKSK